jgi:acetoacetyl-CoA synthetase
MLGRSDGVLNPGGIRFGPTDIYSVLENDEYSKMGIEETLVVGLMVEGGSDEKVILFVKVCLGLFFAIWKLMDRCGVQKRLVKN